MLNLLKKQIPIGIDISDHSIEVLQLNQKREILAYGRVVLEEGTVRDGKILNIKKLVEKVEELLQKAGPNKLWRADSLKAILSLPESRIFLHYFEFPIEPQGDEFRQRVLDQASKVIPFDPERIYWDCITIPDKGIRKVLYVGTLKDIVDEYLEVARLTNIELAVLDTESAALGRALLQSSSLKVSSMIVDLGARTTIISIFDGKGILRLSVIVPIAGNHFTKTIADRLQKTEEEAETLKRDFGFDDKKPNNEILPILQEQFQKIIKEIRDAIEYYEGKNNSKVEEVILAGGSSLLPKVEEYLTATLQKRIRIGNPVEKIRNGQLLTGSNPPILFSNVIGLALRGVSDNVLKSGINLLLEHVKTGKRQSGWTPVPMKFAALLLAIVVQVILTIVIYYYLLR